MMGAGFWSRTWQTVQTDSLVGSGRLQVLTGKKVPTKFPTKFPTKCEIKISTKAATKDFGGLEFFWNLEVGIWRVHTTIPPTSTLYLAACCRRAFAQKRS